MRGEDGRSKQRPCNVCTVTDPLDARKTAAFQKQVKDLQDALTQATWEWLLWLPNQQSGPAIPPDAVPAVTSAPAALSTKPLPTGRPNSFQGRVGDCGKYSSESHHPVYRGCIAVCLDSGRTFSISVTANCQTSDVIDIEIKSDVPQDSMHARAASVSDVLCV